ncbi:hypothetical protein BSM4216_1346 [Bacillus smithii]|nr:hypothetical protein BSM4216_1346 [Bacillus smithii]
MDGPLLSESEKRSFEFVWMVMDSTAENLFAANGKSILQSEPYTG